MDQKRFYSIVTAGLAMFAMLFGAGNIVFPLALGRDTGSMVGYALLGFIITAVLVPLIGLVSSMLVNGSYRELFGQLGKIPGTLLMTMCMILIGPFAIIPRCIAVSHSAIHWYFPSISLFIFSIMAAVVIFAFTYSRSSVVNIIGKFLGPIKLSLLLLIVVLGLWQYQSLPITSYTPHTSFMHGLINGYGTLDLIGIIFFSTLIINGLKKSIQFTTTGQLAWAGLQAGMIGSLLLALVYAGFCLVAAMHCGLIASIADRSQVLCVLASSLLGSKAGVLANLTVAVSCLTTAIALTTIFADFVRTELTGKRLGYIPALIITILCAIVMANLGFEKIMEIIVPIIQVTYPALIVLAFANIAKQTLGWPYIKIPVALTFILSAIITFWDKISVFTPSSFVGF